MKALDPSAIPEAVRLAVSPVVERPDLSGLSSLHVGHALKFNFPGLDANGLTRAANSIRNRARRLGISLGMCFAVHCHGADSVFVVRKA